MVGVIKSRCTKQNKGELDASVEKNYQFGKSGLRRNKLKAAYEASPLFRAQVLRERSEHPLAHLMVSLLRIFEETTRTGWRAGK